MTKRVSRDLPKSNLSRSAIEDLLDGIVADVLATPATGKTIPALHLLPGLEMAPRKIALGYHTETISEQSAKTLVDMAKTDPHAFDLAARLAGYHLTHPGATYDFPVSLRVFAAMVLHDLRKRPKRRGRPRANDTMLRIYQYDLCHFIVKRTSLKLTRNKIQSGDESFTACDAVAEAMTRAGRYTTYQQMVSLCYDKAHGDIRELAAYFMNRTGESE